MSETADARGGRVPNVGQGVSDDTEPAEEYELDQVTDEREGHEGQSVADAAPRPVTRPPD